MKNEQSYYSLLAESCRNVVDRVYSEMLIHKVDSITTKDLSHMPIVYRWWFEENSVVMHVLKEQSKKYKDLAELMKQVASREIDGKTYYALYFGKSNNGYHRFRQHSKGNVHISTIRHTLYGLCIESKYNKSKEQQITDILKDCYFEWRAFDENEGKLVECIESICIMSGKYPLNVDGNPALGDQWREYVMDKRKLK